MAIVYAVVLVAGLGAAGQAPRAGRRAAAPVITIVALVVVAVPSLVQLTVAPALLDALGRDRAEIAHGQLWRLLTSLVVQDGGWSGAAFNLASLLVIGAAAERVWGGRRWLTVAAAAGVGAQLWALVVQPVGAGNSVVVFGLAASLATRALRASPRPQRVWAVICLAGSVVLLVVGDLHGGAAAIGAVAGWRLGEAPRRQEPASG